MKNINNEILNQLSQIRIDINFIKNNMDDGKLTGWAENELENARERKSKISHEEVKAKLLGR
ncbi:MAG: hypothetical protein ABFQ65_04065 [Nanoarchaeota archaeon]